jgi:hypothetical protein
MLECRPGGSPVLQRQARGSDLGSSAPVVVRVETVVGTLSASVDGTMVCVVSHFVQGSIGISTAAYHTYSSIAGRNIEVRKLQHLLCG